MSILDDLINQLCSRPSTPPEHGDNPESQDWHVDNVEAPRVGEPGEDSPSTQRASSVLPHETPSPTPVKRRRIDSDATQYALALGQQKRLKPSAQEALNEFAKLPMPQQLVWLAENILEIQELSDTVSSANTTFQMSDILVDRIEECVFHLLISPQLSAYVAKRVPVTIIIEHLKKNPQWGLTQAIVDSPAHLKIVNKRISERLTHRRNELKNLISNSIGSPTSGTEDRVKYNGSKDIKVLCKEIAQLGDKLCNKAIVTLPMLSRVAFLRQVLIEFGNNYKYWDTVDAKLEQFGGAKKDPVWLSRFFEKVLSNDRTVHGGNNKNDGELPSGPPSELSKSFFD